MMSRNSSLHITAASWITLSSIPILIIGIVLGFLGVHYREPWISTSGMAFLILSIATDALDGWVARKYNCKSKLGALLDTLRDKWWLAVTTAACLIPLAYSDPTLTILLLVYFAINHLRDLAVTCYRSLGAEKGIETTPDLWGKARTVGYMGAGCFIFGVAFESHFIGRLSHGTVVCYYLMALVMLMTVCSWIRYHIYYSAALKDD